MFQESLRRLRDRAREDQRGLTMIELLIALSLMSMLGFAMLSIFQSSVLTQADVQSSLTGNAAAQRATFRITKDVRTATAIRIPTTGGFAGTRIDLKTPTGTCISYAVINGKLVSKASTSAITSFSSGAKTLLTSVSVVPPATTYFTPANGGVQYSFIAGAKNEKVSQVGLSIPRVLSSSGSTFPCW